MSQDMRCRPSSLLGVLDPMVAFYSDRAIWTLASAIRMDQESAVARLPKSAKETAHARAEQRILDQYLGVESSSQPERFRSVGGI